MEKTLVVKGNVKTIEEKQYEGRNIINLILEEGIEKIGKNAFANNNIYLVYFPKSLTELDSSFYDLDVSKLIVHNGFKFYEGFKYEEHFYYSSYSYDTYQVFSIKDLTIIDGNYDYIKQLFYEYLYDFDKADLKKITIVNDKLGLIEKMMIKRLCNKFGIETEFINYFDYHDLFKEEEIIYSEKDEILEKINIINTMIESLDSKNKELVKNKVNNLINIYQNELAKSVKDVDFPKLSLELNVNSPISLKIDLLLELDSIIQLLNDQNKNLMFLKKIEEYQLYLEKGNNVLASEDQKFDRIKDIVEMSKKMNQPIFILKLQELLVKYKKKIMNNIKSSNNLNMIHLTLENQNIEEIFEKELQRLYYDLSEKNNRLQSLFDLLDTLNKKNKQNDIAFIMNLIEQKLNQLSFSKKNEVYKKYLKIIEKYKKVLEFNIKNSNLNNSLKINVKEIELNLCKELQVIVNEIEKVLEPNDLLLNKIHNAEIGSLVDKEKNGILQVTIEITELLNDGLISETAKKDFLNKIKIIFNKWKRILNNQSLSEITDKFKSSVKFSNDCLNIENVIMSELYGVLFLANDHINKMKYYQQVKETLADLHYGSTEKLNCETSDVLVKRKKIRINHSEQLRRCDWFDFQFMDE